jgi:adenosylcobinamide kinase / adenosylcobinamide-phosphate guanylyltransferase
VARIILITGGSRSGKSDYALRLGESLPGPRAFVATCPVVDGEMAERIRKHREARRNSEWHTIEDPLDLASTLRNRQEFNLFLVDCLTLWINNLMYAAQEQGTALTEEDIIERCAEVLRTSASISGTVIFVTNEVGWGIVPENPLARSYRDLVGRCNQVMAQAADQVTLVACGFPMTLKKSG